VSPGTEIGLAPLQAASTRFMAAWLAAMLRPGGTLLRLGSALVASAPDVPDLDFPNTVYGLGPDDAGHVRTIVQRARISGQRPWFEIWPGEGADELVAALVAAGAEHADEHGIYATDDLPEPGPDPPPEITIDDDPLPGAFAGTLLSGLEVPTSAIERHGSSVQAWAAIPGLRRYLLHFDGRPVAAAAMLLDGPVAYLASAGTLPDSRRQGAHAALVRRRLADAVGAGATMAGSLARPRGASARNLERAGLRFAGVVRRLRLSEG
jgi:hypothetical protein